MRIPFAAESPARAATLKTALLGTAILALAQLASSGSAFGQASSSQMDSGHIDPGHMDPSHMDPSHMEHRGGMEHMGGGPKAEDVEARIKSLHQKLGITSAEEATWGEVSDVMRDNARNMQQAVEKRHATKDMTAIDDLKGYQAVATAHTQSLDKLIPAFQKLYDTLSDDQKKKADTVFGHSRHRT